MVIDNGIFVLSAMLIHRRFSVADICKLTSLSRTSVWRLIQSIPSTYPGTVIKSFDLPEYQLEQISPLFNEAGLNQYFELCLVQLANEKGEVEESLPLTELGIAAPDLQPSTTGSDSVEQPQVKEEVESAVIWRI